MLFGYPIEAIAENWFHDCLLAILQNIHISLQNDEEPQAWLETFPEAHREIIVGRGAFGERLDTYQKVVAVLEKNEQGIFSKSGGQGSE